MAVTTAVCPGMKLHKLQLVSPANRWHIAPEPGETQQVCRTESQKVQEHLKSAKLPCTELWLVAPTRHGHIDSRKQTLTQVSMNASSGSQEKRNGIPIVAVPGTVKHQDQEMGTGH